MRKRVGAKGNQYIAGEACLAPRSQAPISSGIAWWHFNTMWRLEEFKIWNNAEVKTSYWVHLPAVANSKRNCPPWFNIELAGWVNIQSARTHLGPI